MTVLKLYRFSFLVFILIFGTGLFAQSYNMSNGSVVACAGNFYDSGGPGGNYTNNQNFTFTICPSTPGSQVQVNFTAFNIENNWDFLQVYDGNTTGAPSLGIYTGLVSPGTVTASVGNPTGCLTFRFTSDGSVVAPGWTATISCTVPCQTITATITSTSPPAVADVIRVCQGEDITFNGSGAFSSSGVGATYTWDFGDGTTATGTSATHAFSTGGAFSVGLIITDNVGCTNLIVPSELVQVSTTPVIVTDVAPDPICLGVSAALNANVTMTPHIVNCTPPVSGTTFLPDGGGVSYSTPVTVDCYNSGQSITSAADIANICINMEHSYLGDLSIVLSCPSGQSITLKAYPGGGGTYLGAPIDGGPGPGVGANYCFSPGGSSLLVAGPTVIAGVPAGPSIAPGTYLPVQPFTNLIGCPLNGNWTLTITDNLFIDDGYIFGWEVNFTVPAPASSSFTPVIVTQGWLPNPDLTSTGLTTANITPSTDGVACYTYSITDDFGCDYTEDQCITVNPVPQMTSSDLETLCSGDLLNISLTADAPSSFSWVATDNPNVTGESILLQATNTIDNTLINTSTVAQIVEYTVTPTATVGGCVGASQIVTVTVNPVPTMTSPDALAICSGSSVNLPLTADVASTFSWVAAANVDVTGESETDQTSVLINDLLVSLVGTPQIVDYTVTPTAGTCVGLPQNVAVEVFLLQGATAVVDSDCQACEGVVTLSSPNGVAPFQYSNDGGLTFQAADSFTNLCGSTTPGTNYSFVIQDAGGCQVTVDDNVLDINFPTLNTPAVVNASCYTVCDGQITLTGTNIETYTITVAGVSTTNNTGVFTNLCPGNYTILVDNGHGCTVSDVALITEPTPLQITSLTPSFSICGGGVANLGVAGTGGNGVYTYDWTSDGVNLGSGTSLNLNVSTSMTVCVTMSENCPSPTVQNCLNISVPLPTFPLMTSDVTNGCKPLTVNFTNLTTNSNSTTTNWQFSNGASSIVSGNGSTSYMFTEAGLYDVTMTVTSTEGCVYDTTFIDYIEVFELPRAQFSHSPNPSTVFETEISFSDYSSDDVVYWTWDFSAIGNPSTSTEKNPTVMYPEFVPGDYPIMLWVENADGCRDSIPGVVHIVNDVLIFAPNIFTPDGDSKNQTWRVYIQGVDIYDFHLTMFNRWGEVVWESYNIEGEWNGRYGNQSTVKDGTYVWVIEAKDSYSDKKYEFRGHVTILK